MNPNRKEVHFNLGIALERLDKLDEAIRCYRAALRLDQSYVDAHMNLGNVLARQDKPQDAIQCYKQVLKVRPGHAEADTNIGNVHRDQGRFDEALACFEQALAQNPQAAGPHHNRALLLLLLGNWSAGWPEYEWRWQTTDFPRLALDKPRWDGSPLAGCTILLVSEQGLGDTIQFSRYVPLVEERGGRVIVQCQAPLRRLLQNCGGLTNVIVQVRTASRVRCLCTAAKSARHLWNFADNRSRKRSLPAGGRQAGRTLAKRTGYIKCPACDAWCRRHWIQDSGHGKYIQSRYRLAREPSIPV